MISAVAGVITASEPSWIAPFAGLSPRASGKLMRQLRRGGGDAPGRGRPWKLSPEDRVLLIDAYWHTNLPLRQLAAFFGVSKSTADASSTTSAPGWRWPCVGALPRTLC